MSIFRLPTILNYNLPEGSYAVKTITAETTEAYGKSAFYLGCTVSAGEHKGYKFKIRYMMEGQGAVYLRNFIQLIEKDPGEEQDTEDLIGLALKVRVSHKLSSSGKRVFINYLVTEVEDKVLGGGENEN